MNNLQLERGMDLYIDLMEKALTASIYDESAWSLMQRRKRNSPKKPLLFAWDVMRDCIFEAFSRRSILLVRYKPFRKELSELGKLFPLFGYTAIGHLRLNNVRLCVEDVLRNGVPGDFIETGAWRGGTVIFMRALLKAYGISDRKVWVADSFEGLPVPKSDDDGLDLSNERYWKVTLETVKSNFQKFDLLDGQVEFLKGWFCDTLPKAPIEKLAILRLDGDLYHSTMDSLNNLYHKVSKGGYVIVDDYYTWESCRRAVSDFRAKYSIQQEIKTIDKDGVYWQV